MKTVFSYSDYRKYLRDFYEERKKTSGYSYRKFSEQAGIQSPNMLKLVMDGEKGLSVESIHSFARALQLRFQEQEYFEALVLMEQSSTAQDKKYYQQKLQNLKANRPKELYKTGLASIISDWYYPAVLVCLDKAKINIDIKVAAQKCGISVPKFENALKILLESEVLFIHNDTYQIQHQRLSLEDRKSTSKVHKDFLKKQIELSRLAFDGQYEKDAKFSSHTFSFSKASLPHYYAQISEFLDAIDFLSEKENGDDIAQLNIQLFALPVKI